MTGLDDILTNSTHGTLTNDRTASESRLFKKKRRIHGKQSIIRHSYAATWERYTNGHVVSTMARRYILNLLAATSARVVEVPGDSSDDSDAENWAHLDIRAGNLDVVRRTLNGIASWCKDEGAKGLGRHASFSINKIPSMLMHIYIYA